MTESSVFNCFRYR